MEIKFNRMVMSSVCHHMAAWEKSLFQIENLLILNLFVDI